MARVARKEPSRFGRAAALLSRPILRDGNSFFKITGEREYGTSARRIDGADLRRPPGCVAGRRLGDVPGRPPILPHEPLWGRQTIVG